MIDFNTFKVEYNTTKNSVECLKKHTKKNYVSYFNKINECRKIIENSSYREIDGKKVYWKNTPAQYSLFVIRLIANYTDIDLGDDVAESFDFLNKNGIINMLLSPIDEDSIIIPIEEIAEWRTVLSMCEDDEYENNRSLVSVLDTKIDAIELVLNTILSSFEEARNDPEIVKKIKDAFTNEQ